MITITKEIVEWEELKQVFGLTKEFIAKWSGPDVAKAFASGQTSIPPIPVLIGVGAAHRYHLPSVRAWLLENFQQGGAGTTGAGTAAQASRKGGRAL